MQLRLLGADDIDRAVGMREAIDVMADVFRQLSSGHAKVPQRLPLETETGVLLAMPGYLPEQRALAIKIVTVFPGNSRIALPSIFGLVLVLDADTGAPRALLEGGHLTAVRTGAASGLATRLMARPDATTAAVFGAGVQARTQLLGICAVRDIREVRIVSRSRERAERLAASLTGLDARVVDDPAVAVRDADIVVTATTSNTPLFRGEDLAPGTHVNAIGAYTATMREVDSVAVRRARVVVDARDGAMAEAGDLLIPIAESAVGPGHIAGELGEVVSGAVPGRTSDADITLFKSVGNAAQDVALSRRVLDAAEAKGLGAVVTI
jgi:alanine dehydrogenase